MNRTNVILSLILGLLLAFSEGRKRKEKTPEPESPEEKLNGRFLVLWKEFNGKGHHGGSENRPAFEFPYRVQRKPPSFSGRRGLMPQAHETRIQSRFQAKPRISQFPDPRFQSDSARFEPGPYFGNSDPTQRFGGPLSSDFHPRPRFQTSLTSGVPENDILPDYRPVLEPHFLRSPPIHYNLGKVPLRFLQKGGGRKKQKKQITFLNMPSEPHLKTSKEGMMLALGSIGIEKEEQEPEDTTTKAPSSKKTTTALPPTTVQPTTEPSDLQEKTDNDQESRKNRRPSKQKSSGKSTTTLRPRKKAATTPKPSRKRNTEVLQYYHFK